MTRLPKRRPPSCGPCRASTTRKADDMTGAETLLEPILALHDSMRDAVVDAWAGQTPARRAREGLSLANDHGSARWHARPDVSEAQRVDSHRRRAEPWRCDALVRCGARRAD